MNTDCILENQSASDIFIAISTLIPHDTILW